MSNDGKELEHIVHLIEQSISPDAIVEHDINLPVIGSQSGRTRQCDVVIRSGRKPRETITIVEVQDRTSKPDINTFGGWLGKLEDVGAQHLICVSRHNFPSSIKEEASKHGNTVRLITLNELNADSIPINIFFIFDNFDLTKVDLNISSSKSEVESLGIRDAVIKKIGGVKTIDVNEKCWSLDKNELLSVFNLCQRFYTRPDGVNEGEGKLSFDFKNGPELFMYVDHFFRVGFDCEFSWTYEETEIPPSILTYEQNEDGILAWVAEYSYETPTGPITTTFPIVATDDGNFKIDRIRSSLPPNSEITITAYKRIDI